MNKIEQLKQEALDLEASVDENWAKEDLYDVLVVAYFKYKDIVQLLEQNVTPIDTSAEELAKANDIIERQRIELAEQHGKCLEVDNLNQYIANMKEQAVKDAEIATAKYNKLLAQYYAISSDINRAIAILDGSE